MFAQMNGPGQKWFLQGCALELSLLGCAWLGAMMTQRPVFADTHWNWKDGMIGVLAALPPFVAFQWTLRSTTGPFVRIREFLENVLGALMRDWSLAQLAVISVLAGVGEEALFRGFLQGWLQSHWGSFAALLVASAVFGLAHPITVGYAVVVGIIGIYLGLLWEATGNLLTPMVTHTVYDFAALVWFLKPLRARPTG